MVVEPIEPNGLLVVEPKLKGFEVDEEVVKIEEFWELVAVEALNGLALVEAAAVPNVVVNWLVDAVENVLVGKLFIDVVAEEVENELAVFALLVVELSKGGLVEFVNGFSILKVFESAALCRLLSTECKYSSKIFVP